MKASYLKSDDNISDGYCLILESVSSLFVKVSYLKSDGNISDGYFLGLNPVNLQESRFDYITHPNSKQ